MQEPLVGSLIANRYRVMRRLGAGGMGTVYVALQEGLEREVALKVVRRELAGDSTVLERFRREALSLAQAQHPHVVTLFDFGEIPGGLLYFAMELVKGHTLRQRLRAKGPWPAKATLGMIKQCCGALACAHALGIIHRDLKPENILLMEAAGTPDFVKIVDFGVAKVVRGDDEKKEDPDVQLTDRNSVVGTPGYIAPEVSLHGVGTDPRSDLYALGVIWFEMLQGRPPFQAPTPTALIMAHAIDPVPPLPSEVPLAVAGLVLRLLAKDPSDRPSSAEELVRIIDALPALASSTAATTPKMQASPVGPTADNTPRNLILASRKPVTPVTAEPEDNSHAMLTESAPMPTAPGTSRSRAALLGGGLALVLCIAVGAFYALRPDPVRPVLPARPDAGTAPVDAGAPHGLFVPTDAGAADAGTDALDSSSKRDAGPRKHPPKRRDAGTDVHPPDLGD